ncbi:porin [Enterobacter cloacae]|nr:porin [Enterobacter cloacae]
MKLKLVAVAVTSMLAAGVVNAAEVFNKDGNKLGKVRISRSFLPKLTR